MVPAVGLPNISVCLVCLLCCLVVLRGIEDSRYKNAVSEDNVRKSGALPADFRRNMFVLTLNRVMLLVSTGFPVF